VGSGMEGSQPVSHSTANSHSHSLRGLGSIFRRTGLETTMARVRGMISAVSSAVGLLLTARIGFGQELHWYRCNSHTHTASFPNSDANVSAEYAVRWYQKHGYQCLVITDHEHLTPVDGLSDQATPFLVIRGQEITQGVHDPSAPHGVRWAHVNGINTSK